MTTFQAFTSGLKKVKENKRLVFFAWFINFSLALILAVPMLNQLDSYIAPTVNEEQLLQHWDDNWYYSFRMDFEKSEIARMLNYSILGSAPIVSGVDGILNGAGLRAVTGFLVDLLWRFQFKPSALSLLTLLLIVYTLINTYLAGGFISTFAGDSHFTLKDFLSKGATYFGRFFRLFLLSLILFYLLFIVFDLCNRGIYGLTSNSPSEMTPFVYYMVRNALFFFLLGLFVMWFDYAKIRIVVDGRWSALGAFGTGVRFSFANFGKTFPLVLLLTIIGVVLMALFGIFEGLVPQTGYWTILVVFLLQQIYVFFRMWLKASFYATQTVLFSGLSMEQHESNIEPYTRTA
jgi:hypothetical protein